MNHNVIRIKSIDNDLPKITNKWKSLLELNKSFVSTIERHLTENVLLRAYINFNLVDLYIESNLFSNGFIIDSKITFGYYLLSDNDCYNNALIDIKNWFEGGWVYNCKPIPMKDSNKVLLVPKHNTDKYKHYPHTITFKQVLSGKADVSPITNTQIVNSGDTKSVLGQRYKIKENKGESAN